MGEKIARIDLLVLVKAYPNPSRSLGEACCVMGVSKELGFVRIYPIPFRNLSKDKQFTKFQVIRVAVSKPKNDPRPNTFRPQLDSIELIGDPLSTADKWHTRREWVIPWVSSSMCEIIRKQAATGASMGIFKPATVEDFVQTPVDAAWSPEEWAKLTQQDLFLTAENKPLEKMPFKWRYHYHCSDPGCKGHKQEIIDWETAQLFRNVRQNGHTAADAILAQMRKKFLEEVCSPAKDLYFFTGNMAAHPQSFLILGAFWPPKDPQGILF